MIRGCRRGRHPKQILAQVESALLTPCECRSLLRLSDEPGAFACRPRVDASSRTLLNTSKWRRFPSPRSAKPPQIELQALPLVKQGRSTYRVDVETNDSVFFT